MEGRLIHLQFIDNFKLLTLVYFSTAWHLSGKHLLLSNFLTLSPLHWESLYVLELALLPWLLKISLFPMYLSCIEEKIDEIFSSLSRALTGKLRRGVVHCYFCFFFWPGWVARTNCLVVLIVNMTDFQGSEEWPSPSSWWLPTPLYTMNDATHWNN